MIFIRFFLLATLAFGPWAGTALADTQKANAADNHSVEIMPVKAAAERGIATPSGDGMTHPPIHITPDKSDVVRLNGLATTILVGNPAHLSVLADTQDTLVLVAREPGASAFTVLDSEQNVLMQRHVIVASPSKNNYIRIRRSCAADAEGCQSTSMFYCPDMCHEVQINPDAEDTEAAGINAGAAQTADTLPAEPIP